jgi:hypothetical protein
MIEQPRQATAENNAFRAPSRDDGSVDARGATVNESNRPDHVRDISHDGGNWRTRLVQEMAELSYRISFHSPGWSLGCYSHDRLRTLADKRQELIPVGDYHKGCETKGNALEIAVRVLLARRNRPASSSVVEVPSQCRLMDEVGCNDQGKHARIDLEQQCSGYCGRHFGDHERVSHAFLRAASGLDRGAPVP